MQEVAHAKHVTVDSARQSKAPSWNSDYFPLLQGLGSRTLKRWQKSLAKRGKAMEGMEYSWVLQGGCPMCCHVSFRDVALQSFSRLSWSIIHLGCKSYLRQSSSFTVEYIFKKTMLSSKCSSWTSKQSMCILLFYYKARYISLLIFNSSMDGCLCQVAITCDHLHCMFCTNCGYDKFNQSQIRSDSTGNSVTDSLIRSFVTPLDTNGTEVPATGLVDAFPESSQFWNQPLITWP